MIPATDPLDINNIITSLTKKIEPFTSRGSGWKVSKIQNLSLCIGAFRRTAGSSFIPTPAEIQKKKAIINIRNHNSNNCFQYSVLAAVHPASKNATHPYTCNKFMSELDMTGIEIPVALSSIPKLESQNSYISISVLVYEEKELIPVYTSKFCNQRPHHVKLLLLSKGTNFITRSSRVFLDSYVVEHVTRQRLSFVCTACILSVTNVVSRIISPNAVNIQLRPLHIWKKEKTCWNSIKFNTCFPSHLLSMPILNRSLHLPENTSPVSIAVCVYQFPQYDHKIHTCSGDNVVQ